MMTDLVEESSQNINLITIEATVPTGFEYLAMEECKERFGSTTNVEMERGRIFFNMKKHNIRNIDWLRSIDHVNMVIRKGRYPDLIKSDLASAMLTMQQMVNYDEVCKALSVWSMISGFKGIIYPSTEQYITGRDAEMDLKSLAKAMAETRLRDETAESVTQGKKVKFDDDKKQLNRYQEAAYKDIDKRNPEEKVLRFRLTCDRSGKHVFSSEDAARHVGGTLQDLFIWIVDLRFYDVEFILNIKLDSAYFGIALTKESKHHRNITAFGPTTLRATICYNLLRLANPKPGDIIVDPLCGGGSIPLEGLSAYPRCFYMCGDKHELAVPRLQTNIENLCRSGVKTNHIDGFFWDSTHLPLKDGSVDIFVTDLPFGKRSGSVMDNRTLYRKVLVDLARVVRCKSGQAVLLTCDKRSMTRALICCMNLWVSTKKLKVNVGGLEANVYLLSRKNTAVSEPPTSPKRKKGTWKREKQKEKNTAVSEPQTSPNSKKGTWKREKQKEKNTAVSEPPTSPVSKEGTWKHEKQKE